MATPISEGTNALNAFAAAMKAAMGAVTQTQKAAEMVIPGWAQLSGAVVAATKAAGSAIGPWAEAVKTGFMSVMSATATAVGPFANLAGAMVTATSANVAFIGSLATAGQRATQLGAQILNGPIRALETGLSAINSHVTRFVALNDPAAVFRFEYAVDSLYATIGSVLVPVLNQFTELIKGIGGAIAGTSERGRMVIAAMAAGTVGLIAFGAAMTLIQTIASGGPLAIIGAVIGAIGGVLLATGKLQPLFDAAASTISGFLDQMGGALDVAVGAFTALMPIIGQLSEMIGGFASYLVDAFQRFMPAMMAFAEVVVEVAKPIMMLYMVHFAVLIEGLILVGKAFKFISPVIVLVAQAVGDAIKTIMGWAKELLALIGIDIDMDFEKRGGPKGGVGNALAPTRAAGFSDPLADLRKAQASAYTLGAGGKVDPLPGIGKGVDGIAKQAQEMRDMLNNMWQWMSHAFPDYVLNQLPARISALLNDIWNGAKDIANKEFDTPVGRVGGRDLDVVGPGLDAARRIMDLAPPIWPFR